MLSKEITSLRPWRMKISSENDVIKSLVAFLAEMMSRAGRWKDRSIAACSSEAGLLICRQMNWMMSLVVRTRLPKFGINEFIPGT